MSDPLVEEFHAVGTPVFENAPTRSTRHPTYEAAVAAGEHMLRAGYWSGFRVERSYTLTPDERRVASGVARCGWRFDDGFLAPTSCALAGSIPHTWHHSGHLSWRSEDSEAIPPGVKSYAEREADARYAARQAEEERAGDG